MIQILEQQDLPIQISDDLVYLVLSYLSEFKIPLEQAQVSICTCKVYFLICVRIHIHISDNSFYKLCTSYQASRRHPDDWQRFNFFGRYVKGNWPATHPGYGFGVMSLVKDNPFDGFDSSDSESDSEKRGLELDSEEEELASELFKRPRHF